MTSSSVRAEDAQQAASPGGGSPVPVTICYSISVAFLAAAVAALRDKDAEWGSSIIKTFAAVCAALGIIDVIVGVVMGVAGGNWERMAPAGYVALMLSCAPVLMWLLNSVAPQTSLGKVVLEAMEKILGKAAECRANGRWHVLAVLFWTAGSASAGLGASLWMMGVHDVLAWALVGVSCILMGLGLVLSPVRGIQKG